MGVLPHRGPQRSGQWVIGESEISFQPSRSDLFEFPDQPPRMVQTRLQLTVKPATVQVGGQPCPQIPLLRRELPPRARPSLIRDETAVGVEQCTVQLPAPIPGPLAQMSADHVMQQEPVGVAAILADQRELGQSQTEPPGLKTRPPRGVLPVAGQHLTRDGDVLTEHRQLQIPLPLLTGEPGQADLDRASDRAVPLVFILNIQN